VQVHEAALLVLGDLDVGEAHELAQRLLCHAGQARERAREVDRRAPPELTERVVPDHGACVIEAVGAKRLADAGVLLVVDLAAGQGRAVLADGRIASWPTAPRLAVRSERPAVDEPEARRGKGHEQRRVLHY
jgi:hypothetical protein